MDIIFALGSVIFTLTRLLSAIWWLLPIALVGYWIYLGAETYKEHIIKSELHQADGTNN